MRTVFAAAALVLVLGTGAARADTFAVVPEAAAAPALLPSAETPNEAGTLLLPPGVFDAPFLPVQELPYEQLQALWVRAGGAYGIPWQVLAAINKIESDFGRNMGPSSAGAVGWMQFMPDTWLRWGMDGSGDGIADPWRPEDAVFAAARYLAAADGRTDISRALFAYNNAGWYVDDVLQLAALFGGGGGADAVFSLDRMAIAIEDAQERVPSEGPLADDPRDEHHAGEDQRDGEGDPAAGPLTEEEPGGDRHEHDLGVAQHRRQARPHLVDGVMPEDEVRREERARDPGKPGLAARPGTVASLLQPAEQGERRQRINATEDGRGGRRHVGELDEDRRERDRERAKDGGEHRATGKCVHVGAHPRSLPAAGGLRSARREVHTRADD